MSYSFSKMLDMAFTSAVEKITVELKKEGFGVLTTIDIQETLKKKLGVDFPKYVILGACNPPFAHKALQAEEQVGLLLPCNVIVYEKGTSTVVSAFNPMVMSKVMDNDQIVLIADEVGQKLKRVIDAM